MKAGMKLIGAAVATLCLMQLVPYGKNRSNPPVVREPSWDRPDTRLLVKRVCFDCHSNETLWPWYSKIAPISWLVYWDVVEGRKHLNFSDWRGGSRKYEHPHEITKEVAEDEMPPLQYTLAHPEAKLDVQLKKQLIEGLEATAMGSIGNR